MKNIVKNIVKIALGLSVLVSFSSCEDQDETSFVFNDVSGPSNLSVLIEMTNPDTNEISVTLSGENASTFDVYFGDVENEEPTTASPGETLTNEYPDEGEYILRAVAKTITGATSELSRTIVIGDGGTVVVEPTIEGPQEVAPIPTINETNVISIFSDVYGSVTVDTFRTNWSEATLEEVSVEDNDILKYSEVNFLGIETVSNQVDASAMTHIHIDVWSDNVEEFTIKLVDFGADGSFDSGDDSEHELVFVAPAQNEWVSYDIPLTDFTGLASTTNIAQYILVAAPSGQTTIYVDNIYFYGEATVLPQLPVNMESTTIPYDWTGFGSASFEEIPANVITNPDASGLNTSSNVLEIQKLEGAQVWAGASLLLNGSIDFSTTQTIKLKVWSPKVGATILFKVEDTNSALDEDNNHTVVAEVPVTTTVANEWEELSFDMTLFDAFDSNEAYNRIVIFPDFDVMGTGDVFYFDDIMLNN